MSKFNPFNWTSSLVLSKYLAPYFKNLDDSTINIGFWNGNIKLKKLELKKEFFLLLDLNLDVESGIIEEVDLIIPWKALQTEPVKLHINGLKLCVSQNPNKEKTGKKRSEIIQTIKRDTLKKFDELIKKRTEDDVESGSFLYQIANNIIHNAEIRISNVDLVYIHHIGHTEIVKLGVTFREIRIAPGTPEDIILNKEREIYATKTVSIEDLSVYFDVYDETFLKKVKDNEANAINNELAVLHNYIINSFNIDINVYFHYSSDISLKIDCVVSPVLIHFNQKQISYLVIMVKKLSSFNKDRPTAAMGKKRVSKWWQYLARRIMEVENTEAKTQQASLATYVHSSDYQNLYIKRLLNERGLTKDELKQIEKFESEQNIGITILMRERAIGTIRDKMTKLKEAEDKEAEMLDRWFRKFDKDFNPDNISASLTKDQKTTEASFSLRLDLKLESVSIIVRDNDVIDALKDLQNHVNYFSGALETQLELKEKILDHIKNNFVRLLTNDSLSTNTNTHHTAPSSTMSLLYGNYNPKATFEDYKKLITEHKETDAPSKLLLCLTFDNTLVDFRNENRYQKVQVVLRNLSCLDLLGVNKQIKTVLEAKNDMRVIYSTSAIKRKGRGSSLARNIMDHDDIDYVNEVTMDVSASRLDIFLTRPFIERLLSMIEFLNFRINRNDRAKNEDRLSPTVGSPRETVDGKDETPEHPEKPQDYERQELFYNDILRKRSKITSRVNISISLQKINVFLPTDYSKRDWMFVLYIGSLKLLKREHENDPTTKGLVELVDDESQEFLENSFQPLIVTFDGVRALITRDIDWEAKENPFLYSQQYGQKEHAIPEMDTKFLHHVFEIFHFEIFIEQMTTEKIIRNDNTHRYAKNITVYPKQTHISVKLPLIIINLSMSSVYILMSLVTIWSSSMNHIPLNEAHMAHEDIAEEGKNQLPKQIDVKLNNNTKNPMKPIHKGLFYSPSILTVLSETVLQYTEIHLKGLIVNLGTSGESLQNSFHNSFHNSFMALYLKDLQIDSQAKFFESRLQVRLQAFLVEDMSRSDTKNLNIEALAREAYELLDQDLTVDHASELRIYDHIDQVEEIQSLTKGEDRIYTADIEEEKWRDQEEEARVSSSYYPQAQTAASPTISNPYKVQTNSPLRAAPTIHSPDVTIEDDDHKVIRPVKITTAMRSPTMGSPVLLREMPRKTHSETVNQNKAPPQNRLIVNFSNGDNGEPCIEVQVHDIAEEHSQVNKSNFLRSKAKVTLSGLNLVINPQVLKNLKEIYKYGNKVATERFNRFEAFMKMQAFWPEVKMDVQKPDASNSAKQSHKEDDKGFPISKLELAIPFVNIIFLHDNDPLYFMNISDVSMEANDYLRSSTLRVFADDMMIRNISKAVGKYPNMMSRMKDAVGPVLVVEVRNLDEDEAKFRQYSTEISVKLNEIKALFLNRVVVELTTYTLDYLLDGMLKKEEGAPEERSDFKFSLLILNSLVQVPRNSASNDFLMVLSEKIGLWSVGKWGDHCGKLIDKGYFDFEKEVHDDDFDDFHDAIEDEDEQIEDQAKNNQPSSDFPKEDPSNKDQDKLHVMIYGLKVRVAPGDSDLELLLTFARRSMHVQIIFDDKGFFLPGFPQTVTPLKINVIIPSLKVFSYEPDFLLLNHIILDNIGESPTVVISPEPPKPCWDRTIWCAIDVTVTKSLIKFFTGSRQDLVNHLEENENRIEFCKENLLFKNLASLAAIELQAISYKMFMKEGGGNVMIVNIGEFHLYDFRCNSLLGGKMKKVISSSCNSNLGEEEDSTILKIENFEPAPPEDFDTDIDTESEDENLKSKKKRPRTRFEDDRTERSDGGLYIGTEDNSPDGAWSKGRGKEKGIRHLMHNVRDKVQEKAHRYKMKRKIRTDIKELERDVRELEEEKKDPNFMKKLMTCYWCRKEKKKLDISERYRDNQRIELTQHGAVSNFTPSYRRAAEAPMPLQNSFRIDFNPEQEAEGLFSPKDLEINELFGESPGIRNNHVHVNIEEEELEIPSKKVTGSEHHPLMSPMTASPTKIPAYGGISDQPYSPSPQLRLHRSPHCPKHSGPAQPSQSKNFTDHYENTGQYKPKFIIHHYNECSLPKLINKDNEAALGTGGDFFLFLEGGYDGEKNITAKLHNKTIILAQDFLMELVAYVSKPFNNSEEVPYWQEIFFNNYPSFNLQVSLTNTSLVLLEDYTHLVAPNLPPTTDNRKNCAVLHLNVEASYKCIGDAVMGPGSVGIGVDAILRRCQIVKADTLFSDSEPTKNMLMSTTSNERAQDSTLVSLLEPFKINFETNYKLDVYRKEVHNSYPATYTMKLELINNRELKHNFYLAMDHIKALQKILGNISNPSMKENRFKPSSQLANKQDTEPDILITRYEVRVQQFDLSIFKMMQGVDLAQLRIKNLIVKKHQKVNETSKMKAKAIVGVEYYNRRKVKHEPLLEPWHFRVKQDEKSGSSALELRSVEDPSFQINTRIESHLHRNSLNINLSTEGIEILLEISKLLSGEMREDNPYCVINATGKKMRVRNAHGGNRFCEIPANADFALNWQFFNPKSKKLKHAISNMNKAYIDVLLLEDANCESPEQVSPLTKASPRVTGLPDLGLKRGDSSQPITPGPRNEPMPHGEESGENSKIFKKVLCDRLGKTLYRIRKVGYSTKENKKGQGGIFSFQASKKVANDIDSTNIISSIVINKSTGRKEVTLRSPICFKNNLQTSLDIVLKIKGVAKSVNVYTIEPDQKCAFPLEYSPLESEITLMTSDDSISNPISLDTFMKEKASINEFSDEEMLSCDSETEFATYKDKYLRSEKDLKISIESKSGAETFTFCVTIYKRKVKMSTQKKAKQPQSDYCWETYIVANPYIYVTNAVPRNVDIYISGKGMLGTIGAGEANVQFSADVKDDTEFSFAVEEFEQGHGKKIFRRIDRKEKYSVKVKPTDAALKGYQWFHMEVQKVSEMCRKITIYCPYLIINDTSFPLTYQYGSFGNRTPSVDPYVRRQSEKQKGVDILGANNDLVNNHASGIYQSKLSPGSHDVTSERKDVIQEPLGTMSLFNNTTSNGGPRMQYNPEDNFGIHIFSPKKKTNRIRISLNDDSWSRWFSLQNTDGTLSILESIEDVRRKQREQTSKYFPMLLNAGGKVMAKLKNVIMKRTQNRNEFNRKKYEFGVRIKKGTGILSRSDIIVLTPRFAIKNETDVALMIKQDGIDDRDDYRVKVKPSSWAHFHWADSNNTIAVQMSIADSNFSKPHGWSGRFKIDEVNEFVVKLKKDDKESLKGRQPDQFYYARINVSLDVTTVIIRILPEDPSNPPYKIVNRTNFLINYQQRTKYDKNDRKKHHINIDYREKTTWIKLPAYKSTHFAWDEQTLPHKLVVVIENNQKEYSLDDIMDHEPLDLSEGVDVQVEREDLTNLKKGYLKRKTIREEEYQPVYCVLSQYKQKMKVYDALNSNHPLKINLSGAKIDDMKNLEFMITTPKNKKEFAFFFFKAESEQDAIDWVRCIKKAAFFSNPNLIHVKVEPINSTKVITFYTIKSEHFENADETILPKLHEETSLKSTSYKICINNTIAISLIDSYPREVICLTAKNLVFEYSEFPDMHQEHLHSARESNPVRKANEAQEIKQNTRKMISLSLECLVINNQLSDTQFPVVLAPNKKRKETDVSVPSLSLNLYYNSNNTSDSALTYVTHFNAFLDTLEIRIDDQLIEALIMMMRQVSFSAPAVTKDMEDILYAIQKPFHLKIDEKLQSAPNISHRIYMKMLNIEPIELIITFRNSPGYKMNILASNFITDFGMVFASIDCAKIRLNSLKSQHIFGSSDDITKKITKHYTRQFWTQLYKVFGSMELLGNPVSLISNLGTGVIDMFYEPLYTLATGKSTKYGNNFGKALAYGTASFISHSVTGIWSTVNKIIRSIMKGFASLTADKDWLKSRQIMKNRTVKSIRGGFMHGAKFYLETLLSAIVGIVKRPYLECKNGGVLGILKGIYQAIAGLLIKPMVGGYDFFYALLEGITNSAKYEEHVMDIRSRPPRNFDENNLILPYEYESAKAKEIIRKTRFKSIESEKILFIDLIELTSRGCRWIKVKPTNIYIILTNMRFFYSKKENAETFKIKLFKIKSTSYNHEKNQLVFKLYIPLSKKMGDQVVLRYESYERAKPLLEKLQELELYSEYAQNDGESGKIADKSPFSDIEARYND